MQSTVWPLRLDPAPQLWLCHLFRSFPPSEFTCLYACSLSGVFTSLNRTEVENSSIYTSPSRTEIENPFYTELSICPEFAFVWGIILTVLNSFSLLSSLKKVSKLTFEVNASVLKGEDFPFKLGRGTEVYRLMFSPYTHTYQNLKLWRVCACSLHVQSTIRHTLELIWPAWSDAGILAKRCPGWGRFKVILGSAKPIPFQEGLRYFWIAGGPL